MNGKEGDYHTMPNVKLSAEEFDAVVWRGIERIPEEIRRHLDNMMITVRARPSKSILAEVGLTNKQTLLGLFRGVPPP